jgi:hypothetical protein
MPRPAWHETLNAMKPLPMFNWSMNIRLLRWRYPKRVPPTTLSYAQRADMNLRIDRSGPTGPRALAFMFHLLGWPREEAFCADLARTVFQANRHHEHQQHIFPIKQWPTEPHVHDHLIAELSRGYDPETFTLNKEVDDSL